MIKNYCAFLLALAALTSLLNTADFVAARSLLQDNQIDIDDSNVGEIPNLLEEASNGTTFFFDSDVILTQTIEVNLESTTFRGRKRNPPTIRCASESIGFRIRANGVRFENLVIRDCERTAVLVVTASALPVEELPDPFAEDYEEGSFSSEEVEIDVFFENVNFVGNKGDSEYPGAIGVGGLSDLTVTDCTFTKNEGVTAGAIGFAAKSLSISNCEFTDNFGELSGGAIFALSATGDYKQFSISDTNFTGNRVQRGGIDIKRLRNIDGSPLEEIEYIKFNLPSPSGGALFISNFTTTEITDCIFIGNNASPAGGAVYMHDSGSVNIQKSIFVDNFVFSENSELSADVQLGGAIFAAFDQVESSLNIESVRFSNNSAAYGGAVHLVGPSTSRVDIKLVDFIENVAIYGGGAIVVRNILSTQIRSTQFLRNKAFVGGSVMLTNGGGLRVVTHIAGERKTRFEDNVAYDGGAIYGLGGGLLEIGNCLFRKNFAQRNGGGVCCVDVRAGAEIGFLNVEMTKNKAERGGAAYLENLSSLRMYRVPVDRLLQNIADHTTENQFTENEAVAGAAIYYRASSLLSNWLLLSYTLFANNTAHANLSSVFAEPLDYPRSKNAEIPNRMKSRSVAKGLDVRSIDPCYPGGGGAVCFVLYGISATAPTRINIIGSNFTQNSAVSAGALLVATEADVNWIPICPIKEITTEVLTTSRPCRSFIMTDVSFERNQAEAAGGALLASFLRHLHFRESEDDEIKTIDRAIDYDIFKNNSVAATGYGPSIAGSAHRLRVLSPKPVSNSGPYLPDQKGGQSNPIDVIEIEIVDELDQVITGGILDSSLTISAQSLDFNGSRTISAGQVSTAAKRGVATFSALTLSADPADYEVNFSVEDEVAEGTSIGVGLRECILGEVYNEGGFVCQTCQFETFTLFDKGARCLDCPMNARCSGAHNITPVSGYWHSSPFSVIMHDCFLSEACSYVDRQERLEVVRFRNVNEFLDRFKEPETPSFTNEEYPQCDKGYEGPVCGSCSRGYGRADGKRCIECGNKSATAAAIFLIGVWQLVFLAITIRSALVSIRDMNNLMATMHPSTTSQPNNVPSGLALHDVSPQIDELGEIHMDEATENLSDLDIRRAVDITPGPSTMSIASQGTVATANKRELSGKYISAAQHVSETIKIFVNYFQVTSIAVNINIEWTKTAKHMLGSMNSMAGFSNGATFTPMMCLLDDDLTARSIYGLVLRVVFPWCLILIPLAAFIIQWFHLRRKPHVTRIQSQEFLRSRVIICFLVVGFFSYQSISEDLMTTVSCIDLDAEKLSQAEDLDRNEYGINYSQFSIARDRYWTEDTNIECFSDRHAYLVGFLGIPGMFLFMGGVPFYLLIFLLVKRYRGQLMHINVINTYGFIYQNYETKFVYWEVCILFRKALIGAIVVFAYPLGSNLQGVMALGVLFLALTFHLIAVPFKYLPLNILEAGSLIVSIFTFYSGIVFNDENTTDTAKTFLSVVLILVNTGLAIVFLVCVLWYGDKYVEAKLLYLGCWPLPNNPISRMLLLARILADNVKNALVISLPNRMSRVQRQYSGPQRGNSLPSTRQVNDANGPQN